MFEQWKREELSGIQREFGKARTVSLILTVIFGFNALWMLILLLDGGGVAQVVGMVFHLAGAAVVWNIGNYKRRVVRPLLAAVEELLPTPGQREEFAGQMACAICLTAPPQPQGRGQSLWVSPGYCYCRRPGKERIWRSRELTRVRAAQERYTVGRGHVRTSYVLRLFAQGEKSVWQGCFRSGEELYQALAALTAHLPENVKVDDDIAFRKTEAGAEVTRKERKKEGIQILVMLVVLLALAFLMRKYIL